MFVLDSDGVFFSFLMVIVMMLHYKAFGESGDNLLTGIINVWVSFF